ncbi:MAG: hypothetical protein A3C83_01100 [Candidatus Ryanbacteria bacterium RIFCSPHIGHO2_02_FULL_47_25]|nr:MAG: hypothetical protein A3C83_01100 [Candidatus Ryanbacteria bacterium RIFCSPHIGHO2_02_FULL_47_25]
MFSWARKSPRAKLSSKPTPNRSRIWMCKNMADLANLFRLSKLLLIFGLALVLTFYFGSYFLGASLEMLYGSSFLKYATFSIFLFSIICGISWLIFTNNIATTIQRARFAMIGLVFLGVMGVTLILFIQPLCYDSNLICGSVSIYFREDLSSREIFSFIRERGLSVTGQAKNQFFELSKPEAYFDVQIPVELEREEQHSFLNSIFANLTKEQSLDYCSSIDDDPFGYRIKPSQVRIECIFKNDTPLSEINAFQSRYPELKFGGDDHIYIFNYIRIRVPVGTENAWVKKLERHPEVIDATAPYTPSLPSI